MLVRAQNATGTTSVGASLTLSSGTGTAIAVGTAPTPGPLVLQRGGTTVGQWTALGTDFPHAWFAGGYWRRGRAIGVGYGHAARHPTDFFLSTGATPT